MENLPESTGLKLNKDTSKVTVTDIEAPSYFRQIDARSANFNRDSIIKESIDEDEESCDGEKINITKESEINVHNIYIAVP